MNLNPIVKMKKISKALKNKRTEGINRGNQEHIPVSEKNTNRDQTELQTPQVDTHKFKLVIEDEEELSVEERNRNEAEEIEKASVASDNFDFDNQYRTLKLNEAEFFNNSLKTLNSRISNARRVICFPDSILLKVQTVELQNCLIGQLARILCLYKINEVIIIHDHSYNKIIMGASPADFMLKVLQYLETPQYLRKRLFPLSPELKFVGLVAPLECHHHLKQDELFPYREGVVIKRPVKENSGSWVDVGLLKVNLLGMPG